MPVTMNEMLLRGCTLKNTGHVLGMVVYTGEETRIQQNSVETPLKYGAHSRAMIGKYRNKSHLRCVKRSSRGKYAHRGLSIRSNISTAMHSTAL